MSLLMELRAAKTLPKRALELAIVTVSQLNACHYCVAHHKPFLAVEGVSAAGADRLLDYRDHPELDDADKLVVCDRCMGTAEPYPRRAVPASAASFQRAADRRINPARDALRVLQ